ncbi:MAG: hypothetical protein K9G11_02740 [Rickettsiaceae bacterium]|nr:hypothetical protein [Rickettsiaceae bacterium]
MSKSNKPQFNSGKLNKWLLLISGLILFAALVTKDYNKYTLNNVLNYYGFSSAEQKYALKTLFEKASDNKLNKSWNAFFFEKTTKEDIARRILQMLIIGKSKFSLRDIPKERWEREPLEWMKKDKELILKNLTILGFVDAKNPWRKHSDAVCILGASKKNIENRMKYATALIKSGLSTSNIIFLTGERYLTPNIDGTEEELSNMAKFFNLKDWRELTETNLIQKLYLESDLQKLGITTTIIYTPKKHLARPTTQTTILELITWLKENDTIKNIVFVSNQPYIKYQSVIIDAILREQKLSINYDVVGDSARDKDNLKNIIEGLGSYIWAVSPLIFSNMNIEIKDAELKKSLIELYYNNPIIYQSMPKNLRN